MTSGRTSYESSRLLPVWYRYSPEHRYRPAASPIIKVVGKDGKVTRKGEYHV